MITEDDVLESGNDGESELDLCELVVKGGDGQTTDYRECKLSLSATDGLISGVAYVKEAWEQLVYRVDHLSIPTRGNLGLRDHLHGEVIITRKDGRSGR